MYVLTYKLVGKGERKTNIQCEKVARSGEAAQNIDDWANDQKLKWSVIQIIFEKSKWLMFTGEDSKCLPVPRREEKRMDGR